jgi:hypothetical protein
MDYNPDCPAWGILTWPKVGEFNLANGDGCLRLSDDEFYEHRNQNEYTG